MHTLHWWRKKGIAIFCKITTSLQVEGYQGGTAAKRSIAIYAYSNSRTPETIPLPPSYKVKPSCRIVLLLNITIATKNTEGQDIKYPFLFKSIFPLKRGRVRKGEVS